MKLKIAVIGCGYWGKNLIRVFSEKKALAAVSESDPVVAAQFSLQYQVPCCSLEEILENEAITGVVIATPAVTHGALVQKCLEHNKHVFVEKPLSLSVEEGERLLKLARAQSCVLMVGHLLQYHSAFLALQERALRGDFGKIKYIYSTRLNFGKFRTEENILWSFAPHDISMILALTGELPETVHAEGASYLNAKVADVTTTHLTFSGGVRSHIFVSWLHPYKEQKLVVVGERAMAVFDDSLGWEEKLVLYPHQVYWANDCPVPNKAEGVAVPLVPMEPLAAECQHFLEVIEQGLQPRTDGVEALQVLRVLDAASRSIVEYKTVVLAPCKKTFFQHETAVVHAQAVIGEGTRIWHFSHIMENAVIGKKVTIGQNVFIASGVEVGDGSKIQNNVSLYKGVIIEENVFCGPSCVFTNVYNPRSEIERKEEFRTTIVERGATIGANATIVCGIRLGAYCFVGAGAVVTKDVPAHALVVGNPARQIGWVSRLAERLPEDLVCPTEGKQYFFKGDLLVMAE